MARVKRVERLTIVPLSPSDAARFSQTWKDLQGRFVDNPKGAVVGVTAGVNAAVQSQLERRIAMLNNERGKVGWILLWALGIPIPILVVLFLIRGCT
jgi:hypothetical protein